MINEIKSSSRVSVKSSGVQLTTRSMKRKRKRCFCGSDKRWRVGKTVGDGNRSRTWTSKTQTSWVYEQIAALAIQPSSHAPNTLWFSLPHSSFDRTGSFSGTPVSSPSWSSSAQSSNTQKIRFWILGSGSGS